MDGRHCVMTLSKMQYFPTVLVYTQEMMTNCNDNN